MLSSGRFSSSLQVRTFFDRKSGGVHSGGLLSFFEAFDGRVTCQKRPTPLKAAFCGLPSLGAYFSKVKIFFHGLRLFYIILMKCFSKKKKRRKKDVRRSMDILMII